METGAAIAIAAGALVLVFVLTKKQEQQTAMRANAILNQKSSDVLGFGDLVAVGLTAGASYLGGPKAGAAAFSLSGERL